MDINNHILYRKWLYMTIYAHIWYRMRSFMTMLNHMRYNTHSYMSAYDIIWSYIRSYMIINGYISNHTWPDMTPYDLYHMDNHDVCHMSKNYAFHIYTIWRFFYWIPPKPYVWPFISCVISWHMVSVVSITFEMRIGLAVVTIAYMYK